MKKFLAMMVAVVFILGTVFSISIFAEPGDASDPVVVLSYINDTLLPKIQAMIDTSIEEYDQRKANQSEGTVKEPSSVQTYMPPVDGSYATVNMKEGQTIICSVGAQLIIRMGKAEIIATPKGGIADVTAGVDLPDGSQAPGNSLLIIPANDGRGLRALNDVIVLVKGNYSLYK